MLVKYAEAAGKENGLTICLAHTPDGKPSMMEVGAGVATEEDAKAFVAQFPKYMKMRATTISGRDADNKHYVAGWITMRLSFTPNKVTGERNDAAIKRALKLFETADKKGIPLRCDDRHCRNAIMGRDNMVVAIQAL